jgi:hypothetical protein
VRIFSWLGVAPSFSNVVGPVAAGFMIDAFGFSAAYGLLLLMPLATLLRRAPGAASAVQATCCRAPGRTAWDLLRSPGLKRLLVVNWLLSMCWDVHTFAVPILGHERGFSASTIGLILGTFTLVGDGHPHGHPAAGAPAAAGAGAAQRHGGHGAGVCAVPAGAQRRWLMGACAVAAGLTLGCVQPMVMSMLHHVTPDQRHGEALAFRSMAINASSTVMPLIFGALGAAVGAAALFWVVGGAVGSAARGWRAACRTAHRWASRSACRLKAAVAGFRRGHRFGCRRRGGGLPAAPRSVSGVTSGTGQPARHLDVRG